MTTQHDTLQEQLKFLRNLSVSAFGTLVKTAEFREQFPDPLLFQRLNGLVYKVKSRFDSYKVLRQEVKNGVGADGAIALAQSLITNLELIGELLDSVGIDKAANEYVSTCELVIGGLIPQSELDSPYPSKDFLRESVRLPTQLKRHLIPPTVIYWFIIRLAVKYAHSIHLTSADGLATIIREITFPPEYQQAGLAILNYFSAVLADKYPSIPVAVSIKQEPNLVTLVITLPDGSQDTVTQALNDYGLVVTGRMAARELVGDDIKALALQQKLELAHMEVRQTRDLLRLQERYSNGRIESLETEVKNLYALLGREFTSRERLQEGLLSLTTQLASGHIGEQATQLLSALSEAISERNDQRTRILLEDIQTADPALFERLSDFFLNAAASGVIGNYVYDWLKVLWPVLPK